VSIVKMEFEGHERRVLGRNRGATPKMIWSAKGGLVEPAVERRRRYSFTAAPRCLRTHGTEEQCVTQEDWQSLRVALE